MTQAAKREPIPASPTLPPHAPRLSLIARTGKLETRVSAGDQPVLVIGSRRDCGLPLEFPQVSKIHCAIVNTGAAVFACDLKSRTGTFLGSEQIDVCRLKHGDELRLGETVISVSLEGGPPGGDGDDPSAFVLDPPAKLAAPGGQFDLRNVVSLIGRRTGCDVTLDDPDVSLVHALVFSLDGRLAVCDLGSRGGTFVNGTAAALAWLDDGDVLGVAGTQFTLSWSGRQPKPGDAQPADGAEADGAATADASLDGADLESIEQTLSALQGAIAASRQRLDRQALELESREHELAARAAELDERRVGLDAMEKQARERLAEATKREATVEELRRGLEAEKQELEQRRADADRRAGELEARTEALSAQQQELESRRQELSARQSELESRHADLEQREAALAAREASLAQAEKSNAEMTELLEQERAELESGRGALAEQRAALEQAQAELLRQRQELEQQRAEHERAVAGLAAREQDLVRRSAELERRAADVDRRAADLAQQEEERQRLAQKLAKAKSAIESATRLFSTEIPVGDAPQAEAKSNGNGGRPPARRGNGNGKPAESAADAETDHLPGPVVCEPVFGGRPTTAGGPPASKGAPAEQRPAEGVPTSPDQLSPELQERFRVLRRLSQRSDAEIVKQLLAEAQHAAQHAEERTDSGKKQKRRWWS